MSRGLVCVALATLPTLGSLACQPGELDDRQEGYLRRQLDKEYPNGQGSDEPSTGTESTSQAPEQETSQAAGTSSTPTPTSEPDATSAPAATTSEAASSSQGATSDTASQVPDCAMQTFQTTCSGGVCHYQGAVNLPPDFEAADDVFTMLTTSMATCNGATSPLYIDLANPENSYLLVKIRGEQPSGCGGQMPPDQTTITQAQIDCLEDWIDSL